MWLAGTGQNFVLHTDLRGTRGFFKFSHTFTIRGETQSYFFVISQDLLRLYHYFYATTFPDFFTCKKKKKKPD